MGRSHAKKRKRAPRATAPKTSVNVPTVRIGSILLDGEEKSLVVFTEDMLINQLHRDGPKIEASFDRLCEKDIIELSAFLSRTCSLLYSGLKVALRREDKLRMACAQLLLNSSNSFGVAVAVLRMGYVLQPGIVIRSMLEAVSTSLHLLQKPGDLQSYQNHTLQSPKTIVSAKKALPPFGQLYGYFSDNFAHIGQLHKSVTPIREYTERHAALEVNLSFLRIAAWLLYVSAELAFNDLLDQPRYWQTVENGYKYDPSTEERDWMKNYFNLADAD